MRGALLMVAALGAGFAGSAGTAQTAGAQDRPGFRDTPMLPGGKWHVHDADRPLPPIVRSSRLAIRRMVRERAKASSSSSLPAR